MNKMLMDSIFALPMIFWPTYADYSDFVAAIRSEQRMMDNEEENNGN